MDAFETLGTSLMPVRTPIGEAWILSQDEPLLGALPGPAGSLGSIQVRISAAEAPGSYATRRFW
jgi:hypothetical protein